MTGASLIALLYVMLFIAALVLAVAMPRHRRYAAFAAAVLAAVPALLFVMFWLALRNAHF